MKCSGHGIEIQSMKLCPKCMLNPANWPKIKNIMAYITTSISQATIAIPNPPSHVVFTIFLITYIMPSRATINPTTGVNRLNITNNMAKMIIETSETSIPLERWIFFPVTIETESLIANPSMISPIIRVMKKTITYRAGLIVIRGILQGYFTSISISVFIIVDFKMLFHIISGLQMALALP